MPSYAVGGIVLDADLELPGLVPTATTADWTVREGTEPPDVALDKVGELRTRDDRLWGELFAGDDVYRLTFCDRVDFHVDLPTRAVTYVPVADLPGTTLRHLLLDQLLPHLLALGGALVLHASCVGVDGEAIAFVGPTGSGKSSLAAGLVRRGAVLLADDFVVLTEEGQRHVATPAYPSLRLWGDAAERFAGDADELPTVADYTSKRRWQVPEGSQGLHPLPLRALVAPGSEPGPGQPAWRVGRLRGSDAYMVLYHQAFRLEGPSPRARLTSDLDRIVRLAARVPVLMVEHTRDYEQLDDVLDAILEAVEHEVQTD